MALLASIAKEEANAAETELASQASSHSQEPPTREAPELLDETERLLADFDEEASRLEPGQETRLRLREQLFSFADWQLSDLETGQSPGVLLGRLLDRVWEGTWSDLDTHEAGRFRRVRPGSEPRDRVVVVDMLFFVCVHGWRDDTYALILDLAMSGEDIVETEAALALAWLLSLEATWRHLDAAPALLRRTEYCLNRHELLDQILWGDAALLESWEAYSDIEVLRQVRKEALEHVLWLRPFDPARDLRPIDSSVVPSRLPERLGACVSLSQAEKLAIGRILPRLAEENRIDITAVLAEETSKLQGLYRALVYLHSRLLTLAIFVKQVCPSGRASGLWERPQSCKRCFSGVVTDQTLRHLIEGREAVLKPRRLEYQNHIADVVVETHDAIAWLLTLGPRDWFEWGEELDALTQVSTYGPEVETRLRLQAAEKYRRAAELKPDNPSAFYHWGWQLNRLAELSKADPGQERGFRLDSAEQYERASKLAPKDNNMLRNWGLQLSRLADLREPDRDDERSIRLKAIEKYQAAVRLRPDDQLALYNWARQLSRLADMSTGQPGVERDLRLQAAKKFQSVLGMNSKFYLAYHNRGWQLKRLADLNRADPRKERLFRLQAIDAFQAATELKPDFYQSFDSWGWQLSHLADLASSASEEQKLRLEAIKKSRIAVELKLDHYPAFSNWARQLNRLADLSNHDSEKEKDLRLKAAEKYRIASELSPRPYLALNNGGCQLSRLADLSSGDVEAERYFRSQAVKMYRAATESHAREAALANLASELLKLKNSLDRK